MKNTGNQDKKASTITEDYWIEDALASIFLYSSAAIDDALLSLAEMGNNSIVPNRKQPSATRNGMPIKKPPSFMPHL